ncbi:MAG: hypothetical protein Q9167_004072 [Letrouitia subvulpina]
MSSASCIIDKNLQPYCLNTNITWTSSFLRAYAQSGAPVDCSDIDGSQCHFDNIGIFPGESRLLAARYRYVSWTITNIFSFLKGWYSEVSDIAQQAARRTEDIVRLIDKPKKQHGFLSFALDALGFVFDLVPEVGPAASDALSFVARAAKFAGPSTELASGTIGLWNSGTDESQDTQISNLNDVFSGPNGVESRVRTGLSETLRMVQGRNQINVSSFIQWADGGHFSGNAAGIIVEEGAREKLLLLFTSYLVSATLAANDWHVLIVPGAEPYGLSRDPSNVTCPSWATDTGTEHNCNDGDGGSKNMDCAHSEEGRGEGYDQFGLCIKTHWWYSQRHKSAYTIIHGDDGPGESNAASLLQQIFQKEYSNGSLLFESAAVCELQSVLQSQNPTFIQNVPDIEIDGTSALSADGQIPNAVSTPGNRTLVTIGGLKLVTLSLSASLAPLFKHPDKIFNINANGLDGNCSSMLNVTVANTWDGTGTHWTDRH